MEPILRNTEESYTWLSLSDTKKVEIIHLMLNAVFEVADKQCLHISSWKKVKSDSTKDVGHLYIFATVSDFWDGMRFLFFLGQSNFQSFSFFPARSCYEIFFRFYYFTHQQQTRKDDIALIEIMRIYARLYRRERSEGAAVNHVNAYNKLNSFLSTSLPSIDNARKGQLNPFPDYRTLCDFYSQSTKGTIVDKRNTADILYFLYQMLCELTHAKLALNVMKDSMTPRRQYRQTLMEVYPLAQEMLVLLDRYYLNSLFASEVETALQHARELFVESLNST